MESMRSDLIYTVTNGWVKPAEQLMLEVAFKMLTGSKKLVTILNKCTHTIAYLAAEEIESEMTYTATQLNCSPAKQVATVKDIIWAMSVFQVPHTPMRVGFNSRHSVDKSSMHVVDYLPPINGACQTICRTIEPSKNNSQL